MEEMAYQQFFANPDQTYHRRYEALRAVFVEGRSQKEVAKQFGYTYGSMRQLVLEFRRHCDDEDQATEDFFFETDAFDATSTTSNATTSRVSTRR